MKHTCQYEEHGVRCSKPCRMKYCIEHGNLVKMRNDYATLNRLRRAQGRSLYVPEIDKPQESPRKESARRQKAWESMWANFNRDDDGKARVDWASREMGVTETTFEVHRSHRKVSSQ